MARGKVTQGTSAPKSGAKKAARSTAPTSEQPVTEGIHRAAERIGVTPRLTLTLAEACDLVGRDLRPSEFQTQVFEVIARDLDVLSSIGESGPDGGGFDGWCAFQNLIARVQLAGKIAAVIGGAS